MPALKREQTGQTDLANLRGERDVQVFVHATVEARLLVLADIVAISDLAGHVVGTILYWHLGYLDVDPLHSRTLGICMRFLACAR